MGLRCHAFCTSNNLILTTNISRSFALIKSGVVPRRLGNLILSKWPCLFSATHVGSGMEFQSFGRLYISWRSLRFYESAADSLHCWFCSRCRHIALIVGILEWDCFVQVSVIWEIFLLYEYQPEWCTAVFNFLLGESLPVPRRWRNRLRTNPRWT